MAATPLPYLLVSTQVALRSLSERRGHNKPKERDALRCSSSSRLELLPHSSTGNSFGTRGGRLAVTRAHSVCSEEYKVRNINSLLPASLKGINMISFKTIIQNFYSFLSTSKTDEANKIQSCCSTNNVPVGKQRNALNLNYFLVLTDNSVEWVAYLPGARL